MSSVEGNEVTRQVRCWFSADRSVFRRTQREGILEVRVGPVGVVQSDVEIYPGRRHTTHVNVSHYYFLAPLGDGTYEVRGIEEMTNDRMKRLYTFDEQSESQLIATFEPDLPEGAVWDRSYRPPEKGQEPQMTIRVRE